MAGAPYSARARAPGICARRDRLGTPRAFGLQTEDQGLIRITISHYGQFFPTAPADDNDEAEKQGGDDRSADDVRVEQVAPLVEVLLHGNWARELAGTRVD